MFIHHHRTLSYFSQLISIKHYIHSHTVVEDFWNMLFWQQGDQTRLQLSHKGIVRMYVRTERRRFLAIWREWRTLQYEQTVRNDTISYTFTLHLCIYTYYMSLIAFVCGDISQLSIC